MGPPVDVGSACGCFDIFDPETLGEIDPFMIAEDDFFAFARQIAKAIPDYLVRQFRQRTLLFLGNNTADWQNRLILNAILEKSRHHRDRSYAICERLGVYESGIDGDPWNNYSSSVS